MALHTDTDPHDIRRVTTLFPVFLGLRLVPTGLWFLAVPLPVLGPFASWGHRLLLVAAIGATWALDRWYRRRYGSVEPERLSFGRNWAFLAGLVAVAAALAFGSRAFGLGPTVVFAVLALFASAIAFSLPRALARGPLAAGLFLAAAALGAALLVAVGRGPETFGSLGAAFSLAVGALLVLAGAIEHGLLRRALGGRVEAAEPPGPE